MTSDFINQIPELLEKGEISEKDAVNYLAEFIAQNHVVFGLQKYSEDFNSDILVKFLEKGYVIFKTFCKQKGDFFTYFYCYVITLIRSELRSVSRKTINEKIFQNHCAENYSDTQFYYSRISHNDLEAPKIPYSFKPISPENLKKAFHSLQSKQAKTNIIRALSSAFYLDDKIIDKLCESYNLDKNDFIDNVQICRNSLLKKNDRNLLAIERRNQSYFFERRYVYQLDRIIKNGKANEESHVQHLLEKKKDSQKIRWNNQNQILYNPKAGLKTSNKLIGDILDLCERQVGYYLHKDENKTDSGESNEED